MKLSSLVFVVDLNLILSLPGKMFIFLQIISVICYRRRALQNGHI